MSEVTVGAQTLGPSWEKKKSEKKGDCFASGADLKTPPSSVVTKKHTVARLLPSALCAKQKNLLKALRSTAADRNTADARADLPPALAP